MIKISKEIWDHLHYDPGTGEFVWSVRRGSCPAGSLAGVIDSKGYLQIQYNGVLYLAHRLAWFRMTGKWPSFPIDHINRVKTDNRIKNLRPSTHKENCQNVGVTKRNKSGIRGVDFHVKSRKWRATIRVDGKQKHLGMFDTLVGAALARWLAEEAHQQPKIDGDKRIQEEQNGKRLQERERLGRYA